MFSPFIIFLQDYSNYVSLDGALKKKVMDQPPKPPFSKTVKSFGAHKKSLAFSYQNKIGIL